MNLMTEVGGWMGDLERLRKVLDAQPRVMLGLIRRCSQKLKVWEVDHHASWKELS